MAIIFDTFQTVPQILNRNFVQGGFNFGFGYAMITDGKVIGNKLYFNWSWGMYYGQGVFVEKNGLITGWGYAGYARPESNGGEWKLGRSKAINCQ